MVFSSQAEYERYHSPEARRERLAVAEAKREATVSLALKLFNEGDEAGAEQVLFDGGISDDGIAAYFAMWRS